jgi:branched-chain amino acid aminotransferase group I
MLQEFDTRNENILIYVDGELLHRKDAKLSVFDSAVQGGDAVWEGLRVYKGRIFALEDHLDRLVDSAHSLAFEGVPSKETIIQAIESTLKANAMSDDTHIRLTLSRGLKYTSGMDPRLNKYGCTLIVLAEWKPPVYGSTGIKLISTSTRRNAPQFLDSKIHHNNLLNNILAKIEANAAGADDGLMLDANGFVAETNACNIFFIKNHVIYTPSAEACLPGITRKKVIQLCADLQLNCEIGNYTLSQFYTSDFVFVTGTMGELVPVIEIDGRKIRIEHGQVTFDKLKNAYRELTKDSGYELSF